MFEELPSDDTWSEVDAEKLLARINETLAALPEDEVARLRDKEHKVCLFCRQQMVQGTRSVVFTQWGMLYYHSDGHCPVE